MRIGSATINHGIDGGFYHRYNYLEFYSRMLGTPMTVKKFPWVFTFCPFHKDKKKPNLRINSLTGTYRCFACSAVGGAHDFIVRKNEDGETIISLPEFVYDLEQIKQIIAYENSQECAQELDEITLLIEQKRAEAAHELLFRQPMALDIIHQKRGLSLEAIRHWGLGFLQGAVTIPIPDREGKIANLKLHKVCGTEHAKNQLFPWRAVINYTWHKTQATTGQSAEIDNAICKQNEFSFRDAQLGRSSYVILVEGEFDMMLCRQMGFNAVTQTFGAATWTEEFSNYLKNKVTYIAYDNDQAGRDAAIIIGRSIWKAHGSVYIVRWPKFMGEKEDHLDFFLKHRRSAEDYGKLLKQAMNIMSIKKQEDYWYQA